MRSLLKLICFLLNFLNFFSLLRYYAIFIKYKRNFFLNILKWVRCRMGEKFEGKNYSFYLCKVSKYYDTKKIKQMVNVLFLNKIL